MRANLKVANAALRRQEEEIRRLEALVYSRLPVRKLSTEEKTAKYRNRSRELLVDFDGTLAQWAYPDMGEPTAGAAHAIATLRRLGYRIIVWSARMDRSLYSVAERAQTLNAITDWLARYEIVVDDIDCGLDGKRVAGAYIDDKAIAFRGDWIDVLAEVQRMHELNAVHNERTREVYGDVVSGDRPGAGGDRPVPGGWEWGSPGGCNDKG